MLRGYFLSVPGHPDRYSIVDQPSEDITYAGQAGRVYLFAHVSTCEVIMRQSGLEPESLADNASTLIFKLLSRDVEEAISTVRFSTSEKNSNVCYTFCTIFPKSFCSILCSPHLHLQV